MAGNAERFACTCPDGWTLNTCPDHGWADSQPGGKRRGA